MQMFWPWLCSYCITPVIFGFVCFFSSQEDEAGSVNYVALRFPARKMTKTKEKSRKVPSECLYSVVELKKWTFCSWATDACCWSIRNVAEGHSKMCMCRFKQYILPFRFVLMAMFLIPDSIFKIFFSVF